jgi:hypothetical protein
LVSAPYNRKIDIRTDREFIVANQVYEGKIKDLKRQGKDTTQHKKAINEEDMKRMYSSGVLSTDNPVALQRKVFIEIGLHFGRRGRENWRTLQKDSFRIGIDPAGRRYVTIKFNEFDKNHWESENKEQYMFETPSDALCSVKSFEKYLSKLHPNCSAFLQRPDPMYQRKHTWYVNAPLGIHSISSMLKNISVDVGTTFQYTNHCVKATCGTVPKKAGLANKDIMAVTGHKNVTSLDSYIAEPDINERACMSAILGKYGKGQSMISSVAGKLIGDLSKEDHVEMCTSVSATDKSTETVVLPLREVGNKSLNVAEACSALFSGAHFSGNVTINVIITNK